MRRQTQRAGLVAAAAAAAVLAVAIAMPAAGQMSEPPGPGGFAEWGPGGGLQKSEAAGPFKVRAVPSHAQVTPGQRFHVALVGELGEGWVYYSPAQEPGAEVIAGSLHVEAAPLAAGEALWPEDKPKEVDYGDGPVVHHVYTHRFAVYATLTVPSGARPGEMTVRLSPRGQICLDVCINLEGPNELWAETKVTVGAASVANPAWTAELADGLAAAAPAQALRKARAAAKSPAPAEGKGEVAARAAAYTLWGGVGLALLAGLTLNIMPCVLPIIPLRIYSLVSMAGQSRRRYVTLGLAFAGGIVLFFVGLAGVSVALKLVGSRTIDLNFYFQFAWARILIAMILLALSANLWGLFNVTVPSKVAGLEARQKAQGHAAAVGMGAMMAVLSLPCSFWLMALALAWAQLQPLWLGTLAIVLIGAGMALPHILLASFPRLVDVLPRPGAWMEYFKQTMGFLLIPAVLYLLSTLSEEGGYPWLVAAFGGILVFGLWMWGSWVRYDAPLKRKLAVRGTAAALVAVAGVFLLPRPAPPLIPFEPFDAQRIADARRDRVVVVKVTAAWCTECKILDRTVYSQRATAEAFGRHDVVAVKADVTERARPASRWVERNFGGSPPIGIIYPKGGGEPTVLIGRYSQQELLAAVDKAAGP